MKRLSALIWILVLYAACAGCSGGGTQPGPIVGGDVRLLIANSLGETLSVAARTNGLWSVQRDVLPTGQAANDIVVEGDRAYIICSLSNSIHVVNTKTMTTIREISTGAGTNPFATALADDGTLWVSLTLANQLVNIDPDATEPVLHTVELPSPDQFNDDDPSEENMPWPEGVCFIDGKVYVAFSNLANLGMVYAAGGRGAVGIIDASTATVDELMTVQGRNTVGVECPDETAGLIYIISAGDFSPDTFNYIGNGLVEVYNHDTGTMSGSVSLLGAPYELALSPTGAGYATDGMGGDVLRFDSISLIAWPKIDIPDSGTGYNYVSGISHLGGSDLAVLEFNADTLYIIDGITGAIADSLIVGDGPDAIAIIN